MSRTSVSVDRYPGSTSISHAENAIETEEDVKAWPLSSPAATAAGTEGRQVGMGSWPLSLAVSAAEEEEEEASCCCPCWCSSCSCKQCARYSREKERRCYLVRVGLIDRLRVGDVPRRQQSNNNQAIECMRSPPRPGWRSGPLGPRAETWAAPPTLVWPQDPRGSCRYRGERVGKSDIMILSEYLGRRGWAARNHNIHDTVVNHHPPAQKRRDETTMKAYCCGRTWR